MTALSPRQSEAVALLAQGLAQKEIAVAMGVSRFTLNGHLAEARRRMGMEGCTRVELARAWVGGADDALRPRVVVSVPALAEALHAVYCASEHDRRFDVDDALAVLSHVYAPPPARGASGNPGTGSSRACSSRDDRTPAAPRTAGDL